MLEDVLLINDNHRNAAAEIIRIMELRSGSKYVIAISGESGSGKSELTHVIAKGLFKLGKIAKPVHTDNFYKVHPLERLSWRLKNGIDKVVGYNEYDWSSINDVVTAFRKGEEISIPCVDLATQRVDTLTTDFSGIDVLILDGLYAIKTLGVDLKIMIGLTYHITKKAQVERGKEDADETRFRILEAEHKAVQTLKPLADIYIDEDYRVIEV